MMAARELRAPCLVLSTCLLFALLVGCDSGAWSFLAWPQNDGQGVDGSLDGQDGAAVPPAPDTFETVQPGGRIIKLKSVGDEAYSQYEDEAGYTVVQEAGQYRYAVRGDDGKLAATALVVGADDPQAAGLSPGITPSDTALAEVQTEIAAAPKKTASDNLTHAVVPPGYEVFEGDIAVPAADKASGESPAARCYIRTNHWPSGVVPYEYDANVNSTNQSRMREAMAAWEAVANVHFVPRAKEANYLHVFSGSGNWSYVGVIGNRQDLSIYNWTYKYIMAHELGHALGLWHEQSRADRDTYIRVNYANIQSGMAYNFDKVPSAAMTGPYDLDSVMHYSQCAFSVGSCPAKPTITVLAPNQSWQSQIGQITHLSVNDVAGMIEMYGSIVVPTASNRLLTTDAGTTLSGRLVAADPQGQPLTYRIATNGTYGTAVVTDSPTGAFTYVPNAGSNGQTDAFTFRASNGLAESLPATVTVKIFAGDILPAAGSALSDRTVAFYWKAVPRATQYHLLAGSTSGGSEYAAVTAGAALGASVGNLPVNGSTVYVTVQGQLPDASWQSSTYPYTAANTAPVLTSPVPGTTLSGPAITFQWSPAYGAKAYQLCVGTTATKTDILSKVIGNTLSYKVTGIPTNGKPVYVQLLTQSASTGKWTYWSRVTYTAAYGNPFATGGPVISPVSGTVLSGSSATISWSAVKNATAYAVTIESAPNRADLVNFKNVGTARSLKVINLPTDGRTVYVSVWAQISKAKSWTGGYNWPVARYTCAPSN